MDAVSYGNNAQAFQMRTEMMDLVAGLTNPESENNRCSLMLFHRVRAKSTTGICHFLSQNVFLSTGLIQK